MKEIKKANKQAFKERKGMGRHATILQLLVYQNINTYIHYHTIFKKYCRRNPGFPNGFKPFSFFK